MILNLKMHQDISIKMIHRKNIQFLLNDFFVNKYVIQYNSEAIENKVILKL
jgi:hypothetical protein